MLHALVEVVDDVGDREHHGFLGTPLEAHPPLGGRSDQGSNQSSLHSMIMGTSWGSDRSACARRGIWVKVNLPIFKDEKAKDVVTYHSLQWDAAIFQQSGWDDWHLLSYIFHSLQGFLGDIARSLGMDATLSDVLQTLDEHYGAMMNLMPTVKNSIPLSQDLVRMEQSSGCIFCSRSRYSSQSTQGGSRWST